MEGLLWFLIWGGFFYVMMRWGCGAHMVHGHGEGNGHEGHGQGGHSDQATQPGPSFTKDPVCGMSQS